MDLISTLCFATSLNNLTRLKLCFITEGYMQNFNIFNIRKEFKEQPEEIDYIISEVLNRGNPSNDIRDYQVTNVSIDDTVVIITIY